MRSEIPSKQVLMDLRRRLFGLNVAMMKRRGKENVSVAKRFAMAILPRSVARKLFKSLVIYRISFFEPRILFKKTMQR